MTQTNVCPVCERPKATPYKNPEDPEQRVCQACRNRLLRKARGLQRPGPKPDPTAPRSRHNPDNPRRLKSVPENRRRPRVEKVAEERAPKEPAKKVDHTRCKNGHLYTEESVGYRKNKGVPSGVQKYCKICFRNGWRRSRGLPPIPDDTPFVANKDKTHCPRGHEYTDENTWRGKTGRHCRKCAQIDRIRRTYGLDPETVEALLVLQNNACAICKGDFEETPHVDHDHETNEVRGFLCNNCNNGLGRFEDNRVFLRAAVDYLENPPSSKL